MKINSAVIGSPENRVVVFFVYIGYQALNLRIKSAEIL